MATPMNLAKFGLMIVKCQWLESIPNRKHDFAGQTVIVTGSNTGIGIEAARQLVQFGASKVIIAVRSVSKGEDAAKNIIASTKATSNVVEVWQLDLSDYDSIKAFAARAEKLPRLDALIQNAGMFTSNWKVVDGDEQLIRVNTLGALLLGLLVLPKLRETGTKFGVRPKLSFVGSDIHYVTAFKEAIDPGPLLATLNDEKKSVMSDRYGVSKLLLFYGVREITARNPIKSNTDVIINIMTPGACRSDIFREDRPLIERVGVWIIQKLARAPAVGGRTLVDGIKPDLGTDTHGKFLMNCRIFPNGPSVDSPKGQELEKRAVKELFERMENIAPGVTKGVA